MRDPNLGTVAFSAGDTTGISTLDGLIRFVRDREIRITSAIQALASGHIDPVYVAPIKPRAGDIRYADGMSWNPGSGEGIYRYSIAGAWVFLG